MEDLQLLMLRACVRAAKRSPRHSRKLGFEFALTACYHEFKRMARYDLADFARRTLYLCRVRKTVQEAVEAVGYTWQDVTLDKKPTPDCNTGVTPPSTNNKMSQAIMEYLTNDY